MNHIMPGYEKRKVTIDLLKHFSTLSIGVLALSAAFVGEFTALESGSKTAIFSVLCFFSVVVSSSVAKFILVANIEKVAPQSMSYNLLKFCIGTTLVAFFMGAGAFVYLVIQNV